MYFMLTGQTPFPDGTIAAKLVAHQTKDPKPVEDFRSDVPAGLLAVLRKMMDKDPEARYQEPIEVADALAEWADQEIGLPPAKEMPGLCPLVLSLTGHSMDKSGSQVPLARALFGPGRSVFRGGGSSVQAKGGSKSGQVGTAGPSGRAASKNGSGERHLPVGAPVSTARTTAAATAPIPTRPDPLLPMPFAESEPAAGFVPGPAVAAPRRRTTLFVLLGVAFALLLAAAGVAVVAAYYLGKANKTDAAPVAAPAARS
jgi:hypothetical protein